MKKVILLLTDSQRWAVEGIEHYKGSNAYRYMWMGILSENGYTASSIERVRRDADGTYIVEFMPKLPVKPNSSFLPMDEME